MANYMKFTDLYPHIRAAYPERTRRYWVLATRYYIGADKAVDLARLATPTVYGRPGGGPPVLTEEEVATIIRNR